MYSRCCCCLVAKSCPTLCDPVNGNTPGSSVLHYFRVCSSSCSLSQYYLTISSSAAPFLFCLQSFPASGSFPMSRLFTSRGQSIGASASASVLPKNIQLISFRIDWIQLLAVQETLGDLFQYHYSKASAFFVVQLSHPYMTT